MSKSLAPDGVRFIFIDDDITAATLTFDFDEHQPRDSHGRWVKVPGSGLSTKSTEDFKKLTNQDVANMFHEMHGKKKWTASQAKALNYYASDGHKPMNQSLRGKIKPDAKTTKAISDAKAGLRPTSRDIRVYRGTGPSQFGVKNTDELKQHIGEVFHDPAFASTSVNRMNKVMSGSPLRLEIEVPKGTPGAYIADISNNPGEQEFLLGPDLYYELMEVKETPIGDVARLRVVPKPKVTEEPAHEVALDPATDAELPEPIEETSAPSAPLSAPSNAPSSKSVVPAVIYKKHNDGTTVAQSKTGDKRMRWDAGRKKFVVENRKDDGWTEESALTKGAAYNDAKNPDKWFEPTETGTENGPSSPSLTPEPAPADTDTTAETPELPTETIKPGDVEVDTSPSAETPDTGGDVKTAGPDILLHDGESVFTSTKAASGYYTYPGTKPYTPEWDARNDYVDEEVSVPLNRKLREGKPLSPNQQKIADAMDAAIAKYQTEYDADVFRAVRVSDDLLDSWTTPGSTITDPAFMSTATSRAMAERSLQTNSGNPAMMKIRIPKGTNAAPGLVDTHGNDDGVGELVLGRNTSLQIVDAKKSEHGVWDITANVVPATAPEAPETSTKLDEPEMVEGSTPVANPAQLDSLTPKVPETADEVWGSLNDNIGNVVAKSKNGVGRLVARQGANGPYLETQWLSGNGKKWDVVKGQEVRSPQQLHAKFTSGYPIFEPVAPHADEWSTKVEAPKANVPAAQKKSETKKPTVWPAGWEDGNTLTPDEAAAMNDKLANWSGDVESALNGYTQHSDMLNGALREDISHTSDGEDVAEWSGLIDEAMYELPEDLTVFRHADMKAFGVDNLDDLKGLVGQTWTDKAYLSASVTNFDELPAGDELHPTNIHLKIDLPKGSRGAYVAGASEYPEQDEFIIARNSSFEISDVEIKDGKAFITMKAVTPDAETPDVPKQPDAPEIETDAPGVYTGPALDYSHVPKEITDKVRAAYVADYLHTQKVEDRAEELRKDKEKYSGYDAYSKSIEDARAELGWGPPVSDQDNALKELEKALPEYTVRDNVRRRLALEAAVEAKFTKFADKNGLGALTPEVKADLTQRMKQAFANKKVAVRVSPKTVAHILTSGRIKSQFETNKSSGKKDIDMRASVERLLFGIDDKPWQNAEKRPIYGYVAMDGVRPVGIGSGQLGDPSTDALTQYGNVQVVLKDSVRDRTTAMFGDSLNNMQEAIPTPINDPDWRSFQASRGGITGKGLMGLDRSGENQEFRAGAYAEAQIHGGVGVEDIEEIVFANTPPAETKKLLEDSGIPWRVLNFTTAMHASPDERRTALRIAEEDKPFIEGEIKKIHEKMAKHGDSDGYYKKDLAKYEKQLKAIDSALPKLKAGVGQLGNNDNTQTPTPTPTTTPTSVPAQPNAPEVESTSGTKLSAAEENELTALQNQISELYGQSGYWRMLGAEITHKSGTGKILTKQDIADSTQADNELKKLRDNATPLVERELELRMKRDGDLFGEVDDPNAERWATKNAPASVMLPGNDPAKIDKIADSYRINDKQTTEHNMSLRSGEPSQAAVSWRSRMKRMINSQQLDKDSVVYRGAALTPERIMQLRPGAVMIDPGSMSTDESRGSAEFYMKTRLGDLPGTLPTLFEIRAPKGMPVADVDYGEFVFDFDTPMRIISTKRDDNGVVNVVAELVPPDEAKALYGAPPVPKASKASSVNLNEGKRGSISAKEAKRIQELSFDKNGIQPWSPPQEIFDQAKKTAHYNNWSVMQVLEAIDAIKPGYKKPVLDWVKTPEGSEYVSKTPTF